MARPLVLNPTLQLAAAVDVSRRGVGRRRVEITDPRAVRFLLAVMAGDGRRRLDGALRRRLFDDGILVRPAQVPRDVNLDARLDVEALPLPAGCRLHRGPGLPPAIARRCGDPEPFLPDEDILWVPRPGSGIALPYTLAPGTMGVVRESLRGRRGRAPSRTAWPAQVRAWRRELRACGYAVLRGLFEPLFLGAVSDYYRRLEAEGYLASGEPRRAGSPLAYDEPLLDFLGGQLTGVVRQVTGRRLPSTFSFLRVYDPGVLLAPHLDEPVCAWNIDFVVGGRPAPTRRNAWPLWIDGRGGRRPLRLGLGDGVLYRGDRVRHWRRPQPPRHTTVLGSLHYGRPA